MRRAELEIYKAIKAVSTAEDLVQAIPVNDTTDGYRAQALHALTALHNALGNELGTATIAIFADANSEARMMRGRAGAA